MGRQLNHADAASFLGAYALDALDGDERAAVEAHIRDCGACQAEVAEHREVAAVLGAPQWSRAPKGLWDRIAGSLEEAPPPLQMPPAPVVDLRERRQRRFPTLKVAVAAVAAAALAMAGVMGLKVVDDQRRIDALQEQARGGDLSRTARAAFAEPGARRVDLRSPDALFVAQAVLLPDGTGYLVESNLPELGGDRTYQLWAVVGANRISVGVLGPKPDVAAFKAPARMSALAITSEVAGGVVLSGKQPLVVGTV
ncbi:MAG TPA: anti-sigma factor [Acidimicrobiales bacterium]|nr:anti-sigma factor [Acidimicrobiales bacterium]